MPTLLGERLRIIAAALVTTENLRLLGATLVAWFMILYGPRPSFFVYVTAVVLGLLGALYVVPKSHRREFTAATVLVWVTLAVWAVSR